MKRLNFLLISFFIFSFSFALPFCQTVQASARHPSNQKSFEDSAAWQKTDLRMREAWHEAMAKGDKKQRFECIIKTTSPITADDKAMLKSAGFVVRSVIGKIATGSVTAGDLPSVAALDLVEAMELAVPMSFK